MISAFANTWKIPELRDRILFTMAMIVIVRLGVALPLPGVNMDVIKTYLDMLATDSADGAGGGVGAILNVFSGGGLQAMGLFSLGIMPYISASIMMQLLSAVVPKLARLKKEAFATIIDAEADALGLSGDLLQSLRERLETI